MTNKKFFRLKCKMLTACGFHIDFQFWVQKSPPKGPPDGNGLPRLVNGLVPWLWDFLAWIFFSGNLYAYTHMWKHVFYSYHQLIFEKTVLLCIHEKTEIALCKPKQLLNSRTELLHKCIHQSRFELDKVNKMLPPLEKEGHTFSFLPHFLQL